MKTASQSSQKFVERAGAAAGDYVTGAQSTSKDQAQLAVAAKSIWQQALTASFSRGSFEKGLAASGKNGWLAGITSKGAANYGTGVSASAAKYATNSGKYDTARNAAASLPRGAKGSAGNLARVSAVVNALHSAKIS